MSPDLVASDDCAVSVGLLACDDLLAPVDLEAGPDVVFLLLTIVFMTLFSILPLIATFLFCLPKAFSCLRSLLSSTP